MVGRPYPARPLSTQRILDRDIVPTTDTSLHLIWTTKKIYIRAMPSCLLDQSFYSQHLSLPNPNDLFRPSLGLLYSYIALLPTELDFDIAQEAKLVPSAYEWNDWRALVGRILSDYPNIIDEVPRRYNYGELRLDRLDKIYRYLCWDLLHGYSAVTGSTRYVDFFSKNIAVIGASTVYIIVILTAMSLGRTTKTLKDDEAFERACYGFTVFAIFLPLAAIGLVVVVFVFMFIANWLNSHLAQKHFRKGGRPESSEVGKRRSGGIELSDMEMEA